MANSPFYQQLAEAIIVGLKDHGPMSCMELIAFLNGYGIGLKPVQAPQQIRQAIYYTRDQIFGFTDCTQRDIYGKPVYRYSLK